MALSEETEKITVIGLEMHRFGFFVMLGMIASAIAIGYLSWKKQCSKGTTPLLLFLCLTLGAICSRLTFCLLNQELGGLMPISSWLRITGGGWSIVGLVGGVLLAGWLTEKITRQDSGKLLDIATCVLPLFIALERLGEGAVPEFDYSRQLTTGVFDHTFLAFTDTYGTYLATWKIAAIVMGILFLVLFRDILSNVRYGDTCILFLMLFGTCSVILESLRYDRFLSISFVGLQQILAAVMLEIGMIAATLRADKKVKRLGYIGIVSVIIAAGICVGLEFALDRTMFNKILIYVAYILVMSIPLLIGIRVRNSGKNNIAIG